MESRFNLKTTGQLSYDVHVGENVEHRHLSSIRKRQSCGLDNLEKVEIQEEFQRRFDHEKEQKISQVLPAVRPSLPAIEVLLSTLTPAPPTHQSTEMSRLSGGTGAAGARGNQLPDYI